MLEIWEFQETGLILKKVVDCLIQFKESQNDTPVEKWINKSLQCTYGRFALKPIVEKNKICENFEELKSGEQCRTYFVMPGSVLFLC